MSVNDRDQGDRPDKRPASVMERLRSLFGLGQASIRDDIEEALDETDDDGVLSPQERAMLRNVLGLHDLRVADVMVPRADVIAVDIEMTLGEVLTVFRTAGHSRLPVYAGTLDDARGMVHIRDFVAHVASPGGAPAEPAGDAFDARPVSTEMDLGQSALGQSLQASGIVRSVLFVPPSMQALDLLVRMQAFRTHMALVIDEYGGTDGLVSIEDIVEMIVGDIEDEHDESESPKIVQSLDGSYVADARAGLDEVSVALGIDLTTDGDAEEVETLGGLIGALAGHVPGRGEIIRVRSDVEFEILDADPRRIKRVRLIRVSQKGEAADGAPARAIDPGDGPHGSLSGT